MLLGRSLNPLALNPRASGLPLPACIAAMASGRGLGRRLRRGQRLLTITRGTRPLVLFDPAGCGRCVGRLVARSFAFPAALELSRRFARRTEA